MSARRFDGMLAIEIGAPLIALVAWAVYSAWSPAVYFPPLTNILSTFADAWISERLITDILPSLGRLIMGYAIGCSLGVAIGVALGLSPRLRAAFDPIVHFLRSIPPPAMLPFGMLVLGVGDSMKISIIAFVCLWPVVLATVDGVISVDQLQLDTARIYNISWREALVNVVLPSASPQIFAGMRISLSLAIILMVISEMVSSTNGVGFFIIQAQSNFAIAEMWSGILLLGLFGYGLNAIFSVIEFRILRWHRGARASERV